MRCSLAAQIKKAIPRLTQRTAFAKPSLAIAQTSEPCQLMLFCYSVAWKTDRLPVTLLVALQLKKSLMIRSTLRRYTQAIPPVQGSLEGSNHAPGAEAADALPDVTDMSRPLLADPREQGIKRVGLIYSPRKSWWAGVILIVLSLAIFTITIATAVHR